MASSLFNLKFLSTHSKRSATLSTVIPAKPVYISIHALQTECDHESLTKRVDCDNFYPRTPNGVRQLGLAVDSPIGSISIHALQTECDTMCNGSGCLKSIFLSTHSKRSATTQTAKNSGFCLFLSTHSKRSATGWSSFCQ